MARRDDPYPFTKLEYSFWLKRMHPHGYPETDSLWKCAFCNFTLPYFAAKTFLDMIDHTWTHREVREPVQAGMARYPKSDGS